MKSTLAVLFSLFLSAGVAAPPPIAVDSLTGTLDGGVGGVAVDKLGAVYVADFGETVWKVSLGGEVEVFVDTLYGTSGNAIDSRGRLLQSNFYAGTLSRVDRDGAISTLATGLGGPVGVTVDSDDTAWVTNCKGNSIWEIAADGAKRVLVASDLLNCPNGITRLEDGRLFVVNFSDGAMLQIQPDGAISKFADIPGGGNGHVAAALGGFYVTGFRSNKVWRVEMDGSVSHFSGLGAPKVTDGALAAAEFTSPNGIAYDAGRDILYTNDYLTPLRERRRGVKQSVVRRITFPTLAETVMAAVPDGADATLAAHRAWRRVRTGQHTEAETNGVGYWLLQNEQPRIALRLLEANVEDYPKSSNVHDSLGEALRALGQKEKAIVAYEKSLDLNPGNLNAVAMLKELRGR